MQLGKKTQKQNKTNNKKTALLHKSSFKNSEKASHYVNSLVKSHKRKLSVAEDVWEGTQQMIQ